MSKIVIIEDEYWQRKGITRICQEISGVEVIGAYKCIQDACLAFAKKNFSMDYIIIDIILSEGLGTSYSEYIHHICPGAKILFISGDDKQIDLVDGNRYGKLLKPVRKDQLIAEINRISELEEE